MDNVEGKDVIDIGCGSGVYAEWFMKESVNHLTCTDISEEMIALVKDTFGNQISAYAQDISKGLPAESDNSADVLFVPWYCITLRI